MEGVVRTLPFKSEVEKLRRRILERIRGVLGRSLYILRIDTGSCNGCEIEIFAALTPLYDAERFGVRVVVSPRHADALLVTGPVTRQFKPVLLRAYNMAPDPKIVIAVGSCGCGGGIWYNSYAVYGGVDKVIPVDVYVPGCPPHPAAILHGVLVALGVLEQRVKSRVYREAGEWSVKHPITILASGGGGVELQWELYKKLDKTARLYLGYVYGSLLLKDYLSILARVKSIDELDREARELISMYGGCLRVEEVVRKMNKIVREFMEADLK